MKSESNIRQRGDVGGSAKRLRSKKLERLYGVQHGGERGNQYVEAKPNNSVLILIVWKYIIPKLWF